MKYLTLLLFLCGCAGPGPVYNPGRKYVYGGMEFKQIHGISMVQNADKQGKIRRIEAPFGTGNGSNLRWHKVGRTWALEQRAGETWVAVPAVK